VKVDPPALEALLATEHPYRDRLENPHMRTQPGEPFTLTSLAGIAGVSRRSLQQSFQRYVGIAPMAYLRQVRLALVHDQLRQADPARETVTGIAQRYGFTHAGRFAGAYRARYGVAPRHTLHE
jgi:transcriptional regulator GlxA family with amidase domain